VLNPLGRKGGRAWRAQRLSTALNSSRRLSRPSTCRGPVPCEPRASRQTRSLVTSTGCDGSADFLRDRGLPQSVMLVKREHVEILERELAEHGAGVWTRRRRAREPDALANADPAPGEGAASDKDLVARSSFRRISRTNRSSRGRAPFSLGGSDHSPPARRATGYQASSMSSSACRHRSFAVASHAQSRSRHSRRRTRCPVRSAQPASSRS